MNPLARKGLLFAAALILALIFSLTMGETRRVCATCGSVRHNVTSETTDHHTSTTHDGVTTSTENITIRSEVRGDQGDVFTDNSTYKKNADGSSASHEELHNEDPQGCYDENGDPWKGDITIDDTTDPQGNRKRHVEQIIEKNGKCIKSVRDWEWDRKGNLIKDTGWIETEVPCVKYNLEVLWEGSYTPPNGFVTAIYGPDTALIPLGLKNGTYTGSYEGQFHATASGMCNATAPVPVTFDITAQEDEFGDLEFTITRSYSFSWNTVCPGASGSSTTPTQTITDTFTLPPENGASKTFSNAAGGPAVTYTLKK